MSGLPTAPLPLEKGEEEKALTGVRIPPDAVLGRGGFCGVRDTAPPAPPPPPDACGGGGGGDGR